MDSKSDLQLRLTRQLLKMVADGALETGAHLREVELAQMFGVSRSPLRAALSQLVGIGAAGKGEGRGLRVIADPKIARRLLAAVPQEDEKRIKHLIARDWFEGQIPREVSESFILSRYRLGKVALSRVLSMLSDEGIITRMPGYGWQFEPTLNSQAANDASYDFRLLIEPGAILQSTFIYDVAGAAAIRAQHERVLHSHTRNLSELFRLDEDFHLFIAECSHNPYVVQAVTQQNKLRRLLEYESLIDSGRLNASCTEHLEILDALDARELDKAASVMIRHLKAAKASPPAFTS
ncbi:MULTISPECIES: GntR family transcriptional regulator [Chelativorans]|uniref:Transcriptional regulator, GntR family n=1 Tax=Chelativorans sp. (strain BNC1) TaxID=266779 RepID=Q11NC5_CHESB|nr:MULTISPECIES: GntR family transcriptional regulator [Chelativorans]